MGDLHNDGYQLTLHLSSGKELVLRFFGEHAKTQAEHHAKEILYEKKRSNHCYEITGAKCVTPIIVDAIFQIDTTNVLACVAQEAPSIVMQLPVEPEKPHNSRRKKQ